MASQPITKAQSANQIQPEVIAIVGPTAAGKSDLAIALAQLIGAEIINADAMQLYRGMDIGTAKLPPSQWAGIPHHVLDVWDISVVASVAEYQKLARSAIERVRASAKVPILVGGSGLYVRAALDRMEFPGTDEVIRSRLLAELAEVGPYALHKQLAEIDPAAALAILPSNGRRIVRALEVVELTGKPFPASQMGLRPHYDSLYIGLDMATERLDNLIDTRVRRMWDQGLLTEITGLQKYGISESPTASRALGYAQALRHLAGELSAEQAIVQTAQATRRFVRRQRSWFRRDQRIHWLTATANPLAQAKQLLLPHGIR